MLEASGFLLRSFEFSFDGVGLGLRVVDSDVFGVDFPERRMIFDRFVEQGLGDGGVVDFAVSVTAIADHVDDDVGAELVAIFEGHACDADDGVDVFAIDVKDGNRLATGDAGREARGMHFAGAGSESDQIVDDDVNRAADGVTGKIGVVHGLRENALAGECGVAVDEQRKILARTIFPGAILFGARAADGDGIDGFQMAGIGNQMNVNFATATRDVFAGRAHVIFHVAAAQHAAGIDVFESGKDLFGRALVRRGR